MSMVRRIRTFKLMDIASDSLEVLAIVEWLAVEGNHEFPDDDYEEALVEFEQKVVPVIEQTDVFCDEPPTFRDRLHEVLTLSGLYKYFSTEFNKQFILPLRLKL